MRFSLLTGILSTVLLSVAIAGEIPEIVFEDSFEDFCTNYFTDFDQDGYGDPLTAVESCFGPPQGLVSNGDDCDDTLALINPGATETNPDTQFVDENCDGVDGNVELAIFVARGSGSDTNTCGTLDQPCATVTQAVLRAKNVGLEQLYIQQADYQEAVVIASKLSLYGGYSSNDWSRSNGNISKITGQEGLPRGFAIKTEGAKVEIFNMTLYGPDISANDSENNSYVVFAESGSVLTADSVNFYQGNGKAGNPGDNGNSASQTAAPGGSPGQAGNSFLTTCDLVTPAGGARGSNPSCSSTTAGGYGGDGGSMDTECGVGGLCSNGGNCAATNGFIGANAATYSLDSFGYRGVGGLGKNSCGSGGNGNNGKTSDGASGTGGSGGQFVLKVWKSSAGDNGVVGLNGTGGGGGGGAGGCDTGTDARGGGGGGGGAGGCGALSAGLGGKGGGGSFGIYINSGDLVVSNSTFFRGSGGAGGNGGLSGAGQPGGLGGNGGSAAGGAGAGGSGGHGGDGGDSGSGGGGSGGPSCAIVAVNSSVVNSQNVIYSGGSGGAGGTGESGNDGSQGELCQLLSDN